MIVRIHSAGMSFKGLATYLTHDPKAKTEERVGWTHTFNLAHDDAPSAVNEMLWTARSADLLKQEAGVRAGGRATENTIKHVSLNWGLQEKPTREDMTEAAEGFLKHMKWEDNQALVVAHDDKEYAHLHMMINTVHPETGLHLDDNFEYRRAQKWALGYERENGEILCAQRLQNVTEREEAPTRPTWMAFKSKQKEFDQAEKSLADHAADSNDDKEDPKVANFAEWKKLKEFQRQERTDFFGEGKSEFNALRRIINREVREEFRERWSDYYALAETSPDAALLASTKAELVTDQKSELEARRDAGCDRLREARDDQYKVLLDYQKETRHGLRSRQEAGIDNHVFFRHMDDGTFRDQWPALSKTVSASTIVDDMRREAGELTGERTADGSQSSEPAFSDRSGHSGFRLTSEVTRGLDIGSDIGLSLIFLIDGMSGGLAGPGGNSPSRPAPPPARDPFEGVAEEAQKRQQAEKEDAEREWRKKQQSYGE